MIEKFDHMVATLLKGIDKDRTHLAITGDHTTASTHGKHTGDPVPLLLAGPAVRNDAVTEFNERACAQGGLGHILGMGMMPLLMSFLDLTPMYGT